MSTGTKREGEAPQHCEGHSFRKEFTFSFLPSFSPLSHELLSVHEANPAQPHHLFSACAPKTPGVGAKVFMPFVFVLDHTRYTIASRHKDKDEQP